MPDNPTPTTGERLADLDAWRIDTNYAAVVTDSLAGHLERRVTALEEVLAARWPRRLLAAWRLGRQLRKSVAPFPGGTFADRRAEATTNDWLSGPLGGQR